MIRVMRKITYFFLTLLISFLLASNVNANNDVIAELIWVEKVNAQHHVMLSDMQRDIDTNLESWSEPTSIYQSDNLLTGPTIVTANNGDKALVWSEHERLKSVLMLMRKQSNEWGVASVLSRFGSENLGPASLIDINQTMWVFWAAAKQGLPDIYYIRSNGLGWTQPQRVNAKNEVPDYLPRLSNTIDGDIEVSWYSYSFLLTDYQLAKQVIQLDHQPKVGYKADILNTELSKSDITIPSFVPSDSAVSVHFPSNQIKQNYRLNDD